MFIYGITGYRTKIQNYQYNDYIVQVYWAVISFRLNQRELMLKTVLSESQFVDKNLSSTFHGMIFLPQT